MISNLFLHDFFLLSFISNCSSFSNLFLHAFLLKFISNFSWFSNLFLHAIFWNLFPIPHVFKLFSSCFFLFKFISNSPCFSNLFLHTFFIEICFQSLVLFLHAFLLKYISNCRASPPLPRFLSTCPSPRRMTPSIYSTGPALLSWIDLLKRWVLNFFFFFKLKYLL